MKELLQKLTETSGPSGSEEQIRSVIAGELAGMVDEQRVDPGAAALRLMEMSSRRITVSTVGLPDRMRRLAGEGLAVNLAVSLHAPEDRKRNRLVPVNRKFGVEEVVRAARDYFEATGRDVTVEYILIDGENASERDANRLVELLGRGNLNVNLIPMNPVEGLPYRPPPPHRVEAFARRLRRGGFGANGIRRIPGRSHTPRAGASSRGRRT